MRNLLCLPLITLFLFLSCNRQEKHVDALLSQVESIVEQNPDSALVLLDSIRNPYELNEKNNAKYMLFLVQAKYKNYQDISNDTLIFQTVDYFERSKDFKNCALAKFYSGRVLESLQKTKEALNAVLEAESIAIQSQDQSTIGFIQHNIGDFYFRSGLYLEAINKFKQAAVNFSQQKKDYKKELMSLNYLGSSFAVLHQHDSAFIYFDKALIKAIQNNDSTEEARTLQNMGAAYLELGETQKAKEKLKKALIICSDEKQKAHIYLNLSKVYSDENLLDSATIYITQSVNLAKKTGSKVFLSSVYSYLSQIEEKKNNFNSSLKYYKQFSNYVSLVSEERQRTNLLDIQKKYDFGLIQKANDTLTIEKQRIFILLLIVTLILFVVAFFSFRKKKRDKEVILLARQEIYQLKEIINTNSIQNEKDMICETKNKLRESLAKQFGILKRIALLEDVLSSEEKEKGKGILKRVYGIIYGNSDRYDWNVLIHTINDLYTGYSGLLRTAIPNLKEIEFRICCLSKAGLNNSEIASFLNISENAIRLRKTHIRKITGMMEHENFVKELDKFVYKS